MRRTDQIRNAYRTLGDTHGFYDGMMRGTTRTGRGIIRCVWENEAGWIPIDREHPNQRDGLSGDRTKANRILREETPQRTALR